MTSFAMNIKSVWSGDPFNIPIFTRVHADASSGQLGSQPGIPQKYLLRLEHGKYSERWFTILNDFSLPVTPKLSTMEGVFQRLVPSLLPSKFQRPSRRLLQLASTRKQHFLQSFSHYQLEYSYRPAWSTLRTELRDTQLISDITNIWRNKIKLR